MARDINGDKVMSDKNGAAEYICFGLAGLLILFMTISGLFHLDNFFGKEAARAGFGWNILGLALELAVVPLLISINNSQKGASTFKILLVFVLLGLSWGAFAGFNFNLFGL